MFGDIVDRFDVSWFDRSCISSQGFHARVHIYFDFLIFFLKKYNCDWTKNWNLEIYCWDLSAVHLPYVFNIFVCQKKKKCNFFRCKGDDGSIGASIDDVTKGSIGIGSWRFAIEHDRTCRLAFVSLTTNSKYSLKIFYSHNILIRLWSKRYVFTSDVPMYLLFICIALYMLALIAASLLRYNTLPHYERETPGTLLCVCVFL